MNALILVENDRIVSVSAGDDDDPTPEIEYALQIAKEAGGRLM